MKQILLFFLVFPIIGYSQDFSEKWEGLFSYYQIRDISYSTGRIYAAADNAVFVYQIGGGVTKKITSINGLSGNSISEIHYSAPFGLLIIGYKNGLIEIVADDEEEVLSVIDILEKATISPDEKIINHFYEHEGKVYISTDYGISVYDLENREFGESFFIGNDGSHLRVSQITILGDYIYAATNHGVKRALANDPNLVDFTHWETVAPGNWFGIVSFQNKIYAAKSGNSLNRLDGNSFQTLYVYSRPILDLRASDEALIATTSNAVHVFDQTLTEVGTIDNLPDTSLNLSSAFYFGNMFFLGDTELGLLQISGSFPSQYESVSPNGPLMNRVFDMTAAPNELWVVYGGYDITFNPYPLSEHGLSYLNGMEWRNYPYELFQAKDLVDVSINPMNPEQVFVSSYFSGLLEFQNGEFVKLYNETNSNLEPTTLNTATDIRIGGTAFDRQGNLYLTNGLIENPLKKMTPGGQIQDIDISNAFTDPLSNGVGEMVIGSSGNIFFATYKSGIMAYNPNIDKAVNIDSNTPGVDFPDDYFSNPKISALAFDNNNRLWIGTEHGIRVMYGPSGIFQEGANINVAPIIFLEDDVAQELLFEQYITDIAVDGANNKWISTADAGIFYVSENGQKTFQHFTKENSPLPSNTVNSVEIDAVSGKVYIGTINGLVAFKSSVLKGEETLGDVYVYPNPVRPGYSGVVTIAKLTENANVKITDITGNLVYEVVSKGGSVQWDTRAFGKYKVASGVYLVLVTGEDALETTIKKIMIIR
ncbi:MAG TPA: two-component regulator propeller domain-containing protein [Flavobacteriaceae bacterium]|nr:two-component regulator propeller domain-containing protein [Flavobacteriaceae bacterium]